MTQKNENRLRRLEREQRPPPYPEEDFKHCTEEELVAMRDAARAASKGDAAAEAELIRLLALTDARKGLVAGRSIEAQVLLGTHTSKRALKMR